MRRLSPHQRLLPLRDSVSKNLKFITRVLVGALLLTLVPFSASAARFTPVAVNIPAFALPTMVSETLELIGGSGLTPTDQEIDLNTRVIPTENQLTPTKFHVFGKYCVIIDNRLSASEPTNCTVIASRATNPFAPISTSSPAIFTFGSLQNKLVITIDTSTVVSVDTGTVITIETSTVSGMRKGQSLTLGTDGGSGSGPVAFRSEPGETCIPTPESGTVTTNYPVCTILPDVYGSVCSVVGNILTSTASTICRVTAYKDGDKTFLPAASDPTSIRFGSGLGNQPVIVTAAPIRPQTVVSAQAPWS